MKVEEILNEPGVEEKDEVYNWVKNNDTPLIELSLYDNPPILISLTNGEAIWTKGN
ncbi:hypothetical protein [Terribacillus sp. AE2B 122]|uniref:hypothetical protein n=1 Tax=Terribacillus sp. AE2B 122 TaxID=1331902 RepID=UPI0020C5EE19|nr:hypothetical protein [Terribacillus sp. AE2B 122]